MKQQRFLIWLIAVTVSALCLASFAPSRSSLAYTPYKLFELAMKSDFAVYGTISALQDTTFDLQCERSVIGPKPPALLRVQRFEDWTCASRWSRYAVGQRVLLFLHKASADWPYPTILSGGGEGEMPLVGDEIIVRSYRVRGLRSEGFEIEGGVVWGARMPLDEFCAAITGLRKVLRGELLSVGYESKEEFYSLAVSDEDVRAYQASSRVAQHLVEEARSDEHWNGPRPASDVRLDPKALRSLELPPGAEFSFAKVLRLAQSAACLGDLDADGFSDIAIDTPSYAERATLPRQLRILFLNADGNVRAQRSLLPKDGAAAAWNFANTLAALGDLDGNGTTDLLAGKKNWASPATKDPAFGDQHGALWLLFLGPGGSVERSVDLGSSPVLAELGVSAGSGFGVSLAALGDLEGDGTLELAVGQDPTLDFEREHGTAVFLLSLQRDGSVLRASRIEAFSFCSSESSCAFGAALACVGDIDGDGVNDLAVADKMDDDGGSLRGAVWILFLTRSGSVRSAQKISDWEGGFEGFVRDYAFFGRSLAGVGDLDGNGVPDLLVGSDQGLWTLLLDSSGRVLAHRKLEQTRREDLSVAYSRFLCVLPGRHADLSREFLCGGYAGLWEPNRLSLWSLRVGPDGAVRASLAQERQSSSR